VVVLWFKAYFKIHFSSLCYFRVEEGLRIPYSLRKIYSFLKRGKRGWADNDVWGLDSYLARVISESLIHLSKTSHGWPAQDKFPTPESWTKYLEELSRAFKDYLAFSDWEIERWKEYHQKFGKPNPQPDSFGLIETVLPDEISKEMYAERDRKYADIILRMRGLFDHFGHLWD
jgi:hypothetical protein